MDTLSQKSKTNLGYRDLVYPSWKALLNLLYNQLCDLNGNSSPDSLNSQFEKLNEFSAKIDDYHPAFSVSLMQDPLGHYQIDYNGSELIEQLKSTCIADNQFYTVYDTLAGNYTQKDERISSILGIASSKFDVYAMAGLDPSNRMYHSDDVFHMIRWASLGYLFLTFPGVQWGILRNYYSVSFRVNMEESSIPEIKRRKYVQLEKKCFPIFGMGDGGHPVPLYHFDQWSVLPDDGFDSVRPKWITTTNQQEIVDAIFFVLNAYLIGISPKYLMIVSERQRHDRNKEVANAINVKLRHHANLITSIDEYQIGNVLTKTLRSKIENEFNRWDKRTAENRLTIDSEVQAIQACRKLGLLPIPRLAEELLYGSVDAREFHME